MKIGYQLKQVRERLAKGLVDKGILRTEKRNFLLFDMATHPIADMNAKDDVMRRTLALLTARTAAVPPQAVQKEGVRYRYTRGVVLVCAGELHVERTEISLMTRFFSKRYCLLLALIA
jgi:Golgi phosphoprotein 3